MIVRPQSRLVRATQGNSDPLAVAPTLAKLGMLTLPEPLALPRADRLLDEHGALLERSNWAIRLSDWVPRSVTKLADHASALATFGPRT